MCKKGYWIVQLCHFSYAADKNNLTLNVKDYCTNKPLYILVAIYDLIITQTKRMRNEGKYKKKFQEKEIIQDF